MYKDYIKEREGAQYVEYEDGFMILKLLADYLYIQDIYVKPEARQKGIGKTMLNRAEEIARELNRDKILGSCSPIANGATTSMKSMLACGFELSHSEENMIYLTKSVAPKAGN